MIWRKNSETLSLYECKHFLHKLYIYCKLKHLKKYIFSFLFIFFRVVWFWHSSRWQPKTLGARGQFIPLPCMVSVQNEKIHDGVTRERTFTFQAILTRDNVRCFYLQWFPFGYEDQNQHDVWFVQSFRWVFCNNCVGWNKIKVIQKMSIKSILNWYKIEWLHTLVCRSCVSWSNDENATAKSP